MLTNVTLPAMTLDQAKSLLHGHRRRGIQLVGEILATEALGGRVDLQRHRAVGDDFSTNDDVQLGDPLVDVAFHHGIQQLFTVLDSVIHHRGIVPGGGELPCCRQPLPPERCH